MDFLGFPGFFGFSALVASAAPAGSDLILCRIAVRDLLRCLVVPKMTSTSALRSVAATARM
jgi:hypothetical protein